MDHERNFGPKMGVQSKAIIEKNKCYTVTWINDQLQLNVHWSLYSILRKWDIPTFKKWGCTPKITPVRVTFVMG